MRDPVDIRLPASRKQLASLAAGDTVALSGPVFTARDTTHARLVAELEAEERLPYGLAGQTLLYAGPTPAAAGRAVGSVGPTTARRMDSYTPALLEAGIVAMIGKGARGAAVIEACARLGAVYFAAVGGAAALLATHVRAAEIVAYPELGTEALMRLELDKFPVFVAIDTAGHDLYSEAPEDWRGRAGAGVGER